MSSGPWRDRPTLESRFWRLVKKAGPDGCWLWQGSKKRGGYGQITMRVNSKMIPVGAHVASYQIHNGPIPDGLHVCHSCDNPPCVNPSHLWLGTAKDNANDAQIKNRKPTAVLIIRRLQGRPPKLNKAQVTAIQQASGLYKDIAQTFGVSATHVGRIKRGQIKGVAYA